MPKRKPRPSREELERMYTDGKLSARKIAERYDVSNNTVGRWLDEDGIKKRSAGEANRLASGLEVEVDIPSKRELDSLYNGEKLSAFKISERYETSEGTVRRWLDNAGIKIRSQKESIRLFKGLEKPPTDELDNLYNEQGLSAIKIAEKYGVSPKTVYKWFDQSKIEKRSRSDASRLRYGLDPLEKPSSKILDKLYNGEGISTETLAEKYNVSVMTIRRWLDNAGIKLRSWKDKIRSDQEFRSFMEEDQTALSLAATAIVLNGQGSDIESLMAELYSDRLKDRETVHRLVENNRKEIFQLANEGVTNLGPYIGEFSVGDREIIPVLIGEVLNKISEEKISICIEDKLVRTLRSVYGPQFNDNSQVTLESIRERILNSRGRVKSMYEKLQNHYLDVLKLQEEL